MEKKIIQWADERGLLTNPNTFNQLAKLMEEVSELASAMANNNEEEIKDAIGDIQVVLTILSKQLNVSMSEALESAYNVIKERKGKTINGLFIKD